MKNKKGAMELSFGMIFSIILIIAFLGFGFYAIKTFLNVNDDAKVGSFINQLQKDVDDLWRGSQGNQTISYNLPQKIEKVCFINDNSVGRVSFRPMGISSLDLVKMEHIDIINMTENSGIDPQTKKEFYCLKVVNKKIKLNISKEYGTELVLIK